MAGTVQQIYRFGSSALDFGRGELLSAAGTVTPLRPKSSALLRLLVENAGRLVSRDAIMAELWPNICVTDDNIGQCNHDVRCALDLEARHLLRTVPRRGYLFAADVAIAVSPAPTASHRFDGGRERPAVPAAPPQLSVAVLVFDTLSNDPAQYYLAEGVADEIITELSRNHTLFVVARIYSFAHKDRALGAQRIAGELGVRYPVDGSVQRGANRVRITVGLADPETGGDVWGGRFDRTLSDFFAVQDHIAHVIVAAIDGGYPHVFQL